MTALERLPSRIKHPRTILPQVRRLKARALQMRETARLLNVRVTIARQRADTPTEQQWCDRLSDRLQREVLPQCHDVMATLDGLIAEGDAVLPPSHDPRDQRRVRKSGDITKT